MFAALHRYPWLTALLAGAVAALGFQPLNLWPLTLVGLAVLIELVAAAPDGRRAAARAWLFGVAHFSVGNNWIATAFAYQAAMPAWLGWIAVVGLSLYLALFPTGAALLARIASGWGRSALVLAFAAAWIVTEWMRGWLFTGFPWNPVGVIAVPIAWPARLVGTYGLSGLVVLSAGGLWLLARREWRGGAALTGATAVLAILSAVLLSAAPSPRTGPLVRVVQPNIAQDQRLTAEDETRNIQKLAPLSVDQREGRSEPRLLLWPEAIIPDHLEDGYPRRFYAFNMGGDPDFARRSLGSLLRPGDLLATGATNLVIGPDGRAVAGRNSVMLLDSQGRLLGSYDKAHLVPYGEYLPMAPLLSALGLSRLVPGDLGFRPGPGPRTLALPGFGHMGVQICYEIIFSGQVVNRADRPDYLFNPSNDAWFGAWGPPQHLAQARLRAIEEGLPVLRATTNGISAVIGPNGRFLGVVPRHRAGTIDLRLPPALAATPFARWGNVLPLILALLLGLGAIAMRGRPR